jgi:putative transposase
MAKLVFTHNQKMKVLSKLNAGCTAKDISCAHGVSIRTLYRWRADLGLKQLSAKDRLRTLEAEHRQLRKRFAELTLDYTTLRTALMKDAQGDC